MTGFPRKIDDIDAALLSRYLARRFPGTVVTDARRGTVISGTATKIEYHLTYNDAGNAHDLPPSLWLKCGLETQIPEQAVHSTIEALFFRDLAARLPINLPAPYATAIAPDGSSGIVLYEDLNRRPVRFGTQGIDMPPPSIKALLDQLAALHGTFWKSEELRRLGWLKPGGVIHSDNVVDRFIGFWDDSSKLPRFANVAPELRDRDRMARAIKVMLAADVADPLCLVHGDPHVGNLFFDPDGSPGLLDWASVMHGNWAWDVAYAMVAGQTVDQRRALEKEQIGYYLTRLAACGGDAPSFEDAWREYVRHAAWMFLFSLCPPQVQPEELCTQMAARSSAAIVDLGTLEALLG
ncbi:MAG: phosphotransferase [Sphingomonadales bacterium]|nr:phosphotransferase [Sphingomonadales bacterium]